MVTDLSIELSRRGHQVTIVSANESTPDARLSQRGVSVIQARRRRVPGVPLHLVRIIARARPELIHAHSGVWYPAAWAAALLRVPMVFTDHGRYPDERPWELWLQRLCAQVTSEVVTVSSALSEFVHTRLGVAYRPKVIDNGIDVSRFATVDPARRAALRQEWGFREDQVVVMMSGRLVPIKNHAALLEALATSGNPSLAAVFVGSGPLETELRARVTELRLNDRVRFLGFRDDVQDCLSASDILAMPSSNEGLPLALLEAFAAGLAIVATRVGGIPAALGDPTAGVLVPPGDADALRMALERLTDAECRRRFASLARQRAGHYSVERMTDVYEELYARHTDR
jgi:glycosyltransferase involved in cell wall biosynthesis